ncbi:MAG: phosphoribosyltransferase [Chloroflexi bacterium]|nr:phosphoribosyltransferase [Chloroflexota bacterium]
MHVPRAMSGDVVFEDREAAGRALATGLAEAGTLASVVLGLTRGGVPVASQVARAFGLPLDVVVVKKLRAPFSDELAIGAICADGQRVLRQDVIQQLGVKDTYLSREGEARLAEAREQEQGYRGHHLALEVAGASVVIVDDGIATGATMEAAVLSARQRGAREITVAAPVGSPEGCAVLGRIADRVFCLATPEEFWAVGQFYLYFPQVSDEEVRRLLDESRARRGRTRTP